MNIDLANEQLVELSEEFTNPVEVLFDSDNVSLEGRYGDELSLFRARKVWIKVLETNFLLEKGDDFNFIINSRLEDGRFLLKCSFKTACGRYAFWRLINSQAPESQYLIETAHIPEGTSQQYELMRAPDLKAIAHLERSNEDLKNAAKLVNWLSKLFK